MTERPLLRSPSLKRFRLPLAALAVGVLGSVSLWNALRNTQHDRLELVVRSAAYETAAAATARFAAQRSELAGLWQRFDSQPIDAWLADASALFGRWPEFERLLWLEPGDAEVISIAGPPRPATSLTASEAEALAPLLATARAVTSTVVLGPEQGPGGARYHFVAPAPRARDRAGILIATARLDATLEPIVGPIQRSFRTLAIWDGREVLRLGTAAPDTPVKTAFATLPGGRRLEIHTTASPLLVGGAAESPRYALVAGLLASLLLAWLGFLVRTLRDRNAEILRARRRAEAETARALEAERKAIRLAADLENRVAARTRQLAEAVEELEAFNYSVSHDLRSPLGAIANFCAILAADHGPALGPEGTDLIARIGRSTHAAVAMMDGLLELSQLGSRPVSLETVDMEQLARETMEQVRSTFGPRELRFELGSLPPASGDPALLRLVLSNLLRNALKYTQEREKPFIGVSGQRVADECVYAVRDDGIGFEMRYAGRLFRPFQRLHGADAFPGSGIGLAIVARAIRRHGGQVWAEGEPGRGATFSFSLPTQPREGEPGGSA
jgi:signal transduction histidine kinase